MLIETTRVQQMAICVDGGYLRWKRLLDVVFCMLIFVPLVVVTLFVTALIRLDSPGPVFFRQRRVGLNGKEFTMYKFRSMHIQSDAAVHREAIKRYMLGEVLEEQASGQMSYKKVSDPRITRVGRFLRKTSIDELPQFFNVLRGEMTLVGPRPALPYEVEMYQEQDRLRLCGKPGLTGYWQIYGRSRVPFQTMVEMDIAYLHRQSLLEDLKLILLTVPVMLLGIGGA